MSICSKSTIPHFNFKLIFQSLTLIILFCLFSIVGVTITTIGSPTAGDSYTLKCSVSGTSGPASYQWFGPPNGDSITNSSSRIVFSNSSLTLLEFSPLQVSHAGVYTCRATVNGVVVEHSASVTVNGENYNDAYKSRKLDLIIESETL